MAGARAVSGQLHLARRGLRGLALAAGFAVLSSCAPTYQNHGFIPFEEDLAQITVGVDTRETVLELAGTPTANGVVGEDVFYYVSSRFRHFAFLEPEEISREVLAISFDTAGRVRNIERFGLEDGQVVVLERRVTDDNLPDSTFLRQLLNSIGNFNPGAFLGSGDSDF